MNLQHSFSAITTPVPRICFLLSLVGMLASCRQAPTIQVPTTATPLSLESAAFQADTPIPSQYTCDDQNSSPPLTWTDIPEATQSLALIMDDPDAPNGTFTHWVVYDMPATLDNLPEGVPQTPALDAGGSQGLNDFYGLGYGGPCPPSGTHRYRFKLYALDQPLGLPPEASLAEVAEAMAGHIVGFGELTAPYTRQP